MTARRDFLRKPSALAFMTRAIVTPRRPGVQAAPASLAATWRGHRVGGSVLDDFLALTGLEGHPGWALLYPHVVGFRLQMVVLTDRGFPLPIWNALQIRNRLTLHRAFSQGTMIDFEVHPAAQRVLDKGVEIDLRCTAHSGGELLWEASNTFYYRGRFGAPGEPSPLAASPAVVADIADRWTMPADGQIRCGRLTGDYNPIHLSDWYARRFGFSRAFQHPQRVLGECLARLSRPGVVMPVQLDTWLKGPVYYGADVALRVAEASSEATFALHLDGDERPAIVGRWSSAATQTRLPE